MPELIEKPIKYVFNAKFCINLSISGLKSDRLLVPKALRLYNPYTGILP
jgi:hypothetical protein